MIRMSEIILTSRNIIGGPAESGTSDDVIPRSSVEVVLKIQIGDSHVELHADLLAMFVVVKALEHKI